ncbi:hypothetical protein HK405_012384 [Cladochytrium tenue]|nr:hypothetical protein HK405_012384 [Cladochytrium tenue]
MRNPKLISLPLVLAGAVACHAAQPFLTQISSNSWVLGNDLWNATIGPTYGKPIYFNNREIVGEAVGHYAGFNSGGEVELDNQAADIFASGDDFIDVRFNTSYGEFHWVLFDGLPGAYQYFVNSNLPVLGIFRSLVRLDNTTFVNGHTAIKDEALPLYSSILAGTKVQDETWLTADGSYITKYDWSSFNKDLSFYGVYGSGFGSWYIRAGRDYLNGNHLKQELLVHRESASGDTVQLNVVHGTHFQASSSDVLPAGKILGPWLWYLNNGSVTDASQRAVQEEAAWPYEFVTDTAYQQRVAHVTGSIVLSDGRPAAGAAVFLGDADANETSLDQGRGFYYTTYADSDGAFEFQHVRAGTYGLEAWGNGGSLAAVTTRLLVDEVAVTAGENEVSLGQLEWALAAGRTLVFQIGALDRKTTGFRNGGAPYQHALIAQSPANVTFVVGSSLPADDWWFGQSAIGSWDVVFEVTPEDLALNRSGVLTASLAGYSKGTTGSVYINRAVVANATVSRLGSLTDGLPSDPSACRSATTAGEWHLIEILVPTDLLVEGNNTFSFVVDTYTLWRGWFWDSILFEWE